MTDALLITPLAPVRTGETLAYTVDFADELGADTITTPSAENVPSGIAVSGVAFSGSIVSFKITPSAGSEGKSFRFNLSIATTGTSTIKRDFNVAVVATR